MRRLNWFHLLKIMLVTLVGCSSNPAADTSQEVFQHGLTGSGHAPDDPMSIDHVSLVTVSTQGVDIANLRLSGIFDKTGKLPLNGDELCFAQCAKK